MAVGDDALKSGDGRSAAGRTGLFARSPVLAPWLVFALTSGVVLGGCGEPPSQSKPAEKAPAESKPAERKPGDGTPAGNGEAGAKSGDKPADSSNATGGDQPKYAKVEVKPNQGLPTTQVTIAGQKFTLEVAATPESRKTGLMARESIAADGGMVFVFPPSQFMIQSFWMGDCLTDMDILFLDNSGRILAMHEMKVERRLEGENEMAYNARATKYSSRYRSGLAVELAPGSIKKLGLKVGDQLKLDLAGLKKMAK